MDMDADLERTLKWICRFTPRRDRVGWAILVGQIVWAAVAAPLALFAFGIAKLVQGVAVGAYVIVAIVFFGAMAYIGLMLFLKIAAFALR